MWGLATRVQTHTEAQDRRGRAARAASILSTDVIDERAAKRVLALQVVVVFFAVTAGNMVNVALPTIGADFGVSEGTYGWIVTGYMLTFAVFSAIHGRLADRIGARRLYLAGILVFGFGSALTAALPNIE